MTSSTTQQVAELCIEGVCGGTGGGIGRLIAFPFESLKTQISLDPNISLTHLVTKNPTALYKGVSYSVVDAFIAKAQAFICMEGFRRIYSKLTDGGEIKSLPGQMLIGYWADVLCLPVIIPLETMVTRMQTPGAEKASFAEIFSLKVLYEQLPIFLILSGKPGVELGLFSFLKNKILELQAQKKLERKMSSRKNIVGIKDNLENSDLKRSPSASSQIVPKQSLSAGKAFLLGAFSRLVATMIFYPAINIKTLYAANKDNSKSVMQLLFDNFKELGLVKMYTGASFELGRGVVQSAVMFMIMERLRGIVRRVLFKALGLDKTSNVLYSH